MLNTINGIMLKGIDELIMHKSFIFIYLFIILLQKSIQMMSKLPKSFSGDEVIISKSYLT